MKCLSCLVLLLAAIGLSGCSRNYVVTLQNGTRLTTIGKPKLKGSNYVFKDARGTPSYVPAGRVREIAPASMVSSNNNNFKQGPSR